MSARAARVSAALAAGLVAAIQLRELVQDSPRAIALHGRLVDDAFFYTIIARRFHESGFASFDGEMPTNGVQPGWMALTAAVQAVIPSGDSLAPMLALSWLLYTIFAGWMVWYLSRRCSWQAIIAPALAFSALIAANPAFQTLAIKGLETPLLLALLPVFLVLADRVAARAPKHASSVCLQIGIALTATALFFARTDLFWVSVVSFTWLLWRNGARAGVVFAGVTALCVAPYLAANLIHGGSLLPISGRVKLFYLASVAPDLGTYLASDEWRGFVTSFGSVFPLGRVGEWLAVPALLAAAAYAVLRPERLSPGLRLLGVSAGLHLVFMQLVYRELRPYTGYYFVVELVWISAVAAVALGDVASRRPRLSLVLAGCIALLAAVAAWREDGAADLERYWESRLALADDIRRIAKPNERIAAFWPGAFSYFSGRDVIPLDGVIGSEAYLESYLKTAREFDYLRERRAAYLALYLPLPPEQLRALAEPPEIRSWSDLGTLRLWQHREVPWKTVAARPFTRRGGGWYLIEFPWNGRP